MTGAYQLEISSIGEPRLSGTFIFDSLNTLDLNPVEGNPFSDATFDHRGSTTNSPFVFRSTLSTVEFGALAGSGRIDLGGRNLTVGGNDESTTYLGTINTTGNRTFRKIGEGTFRLASGNNSADMNFSSVRIDEGAVVINRNTTFGNADILFINNDAASPNPNEEMILIIENRLGSPSSLTLNNDFLMDNQTFRDAILVIEEDLTVVHQGKFTFDNSIGLSVQPLIVRGGGTLVLPNTIAEPWDILGGLVLREGTTLRSDAEFTVESGSIAVQDGSRWEINGGDQTLDRISVDPNGTVDFGTSGATLRILNRSNRNAIMRGTMTGDGKLLVDYGNNFRYVWRGNATGLLGGIELRSGAFLYETGSLGPIEDPVVFSGGRFLHATTINSPRPLLIKADSFFTSEDLEDNAGNSNWGALNGDGDHRFTKNGAGLLAFSAPGDFTGTVRVTEGRLEARHENAFLHATIDPRDGGEFGFNSADTNTFRISGLIGNSTGQVFLENESTTPSDPFWLIVDQSEDTSFFGNFSGEGGLEKQGTGALTLSTLDYTGKTLVSAGTLTIASTVNLAGDTMEVAADGALVLNNANLRDLVNQGTVINPSSTNTLNLQGDLSGNGVFQGTMRFSGTTRPGNGIGSFTVNGDLTFGSAHSLEVEIGGTAPGTGYDQIEVSGSASLAGTVAFTLVDDFVPEVGDSFAVITADSLSGNFSSNIDLSGAELPADLFWGTDDLNSAGIIRVVGQTFARWADGFGLDADAESEPASDGVSLLKKYALGLDPTIRTPKEDLPVFSTIEDNGDTFLTVTVNRSAVRDDVTIAGEVSENLSDWSAAEVDLIEETSNLLVFRDTFAIDNSDKRFLRVNFVLLEED